MHQSNKKLRIAMNGRKGITYAEGGIKIDVEKLTTGMITTLKQGITKLKKVIHLIWSPLYKRNAIW